MSEKRPPGLMLYKEARTILVHLAPEQLYSVFHAMIKYFEHGDIPNFAPGTIEALSWAIITPQIDSHMMKYQDISEKRRLAALNKNKGNADADADT